MTGFSASTPEAVNVMRLIYLKSGLKMLKKGIRLSAKVPSCRTIAKALPGCPQTNNLDVLIEFVESLIQAEATNLRAQIESF